MVNAQEYINQKYPIKEIREKETSLDLSNQNLEGELDLTDFTSLETLYLSHYITEDKVKNKKEGVRIIGFKDAQEYLEEYLKESYPEKAKSEITKLNFDSKNLEGSLDLSGFTNLTRLDCDWNKLTNLRVNDCSNLKILYCRSSRLTDLNLTNLNELENLYCQDNNLVKINYPLGSEKLTVLNIQNNEVEEKNLSVFSKYINLQSLYIGNDSKERLEKDIYNRFAGSLESLKNLTKLGRLNISNTNIEEGLEYLPESVGTLTVSFLNNTNFTPKVIKIYEQITSCDNNINIWREWKKRGFDGQKLNFVKQLKESGIKVNEYDFIDYLKKENHDFLNTNKDELQEKYKEYHQAQTWLDFNYPIEKRDEVTEIDISEKNLKGKLDLTTFTKLEKLNCNENKITSLNVGGLNKLVELHCPNNQLVNLELNGCENLQVLHAYNNREKEVVNELSDINFLSQLPNPERLKSLYLWANNIHGDLTPFAHFTNLEELDLGMRGFSVEFTEKKSNKFYGSLEPLQNLTRLKKLDIANTDIDSGLEYLPKSIKEIYYSAKERTNSKIKEISEELKWWQDINHDFTPKFKKEWKDKGLDYEETKEWVSRCKLEAKDSSLVEYLRKKNITAQEASGYIKKLREEYEHKYVNRKTDDDTPKEEILSQTYFTYKDWEEIKSDFFRDDKFIDYLKETKKSEPSKLLVSDLIVWYHNAQTYIDSYYSSEERKSVPRLNISKKDLRGELVIKEWQNLDEIYCSDNNLSNITLNNLPELKSLVARRCKLDKLIIDKCLSLQKVDVGENSITDLDFLKKLDSNKLTSLIIDNNEFLPVQDLSFLSGLSNLEQLTLSNTGQTVVHGPNFQESLKNLKNLTKLNYLDISGMSINSDKLEEFLPNNLRDYYLDGEKISREQDAQGLINKEYPNKEEREKVKEIKINNKFLEGELDLRDFTNLERLNCSNNELVGIDLSNNKKIKYLNLSNNNFNFSQQKLDFLSHLINLEELHLENSDEKNIKQNIYNHFVGSLKSLKNLSRLRILDIRNTDIDSDWEYLTDNLKHIYCSAKIRQNAGVEIIEKDLEKHDYHISKGKAYYWTKYGPEFKERASIFEKELEELRKGYYELHLARKESNNSNLNKIVSDKVELYIDYRNKELNNLLENAKSRLDEKEKNWLKMLSSFGNQFKQTKEKLSRFLQEKKLTEEEEKKLRSIQEELERLEEIKKGKGGLIAEKSTLEKKSNELEKSLGEVRDKLKSAESRGLLNSLLEFQIFIVELGDNPRIQKKMDELKQRLKDIEKELEIDDLCQKQKEIIQLEEIISFLETSQEKEVENKSQMEISPKGTQ